MRSAYMDYCYCGRVFSYGSCRNDIPALTLKQVVFNLVKYTTNNIIHSQYFLTPSTLIPSLPNPNNIKVFKKAKIILGFFFKTHWPCAPRPAPQRPRTVTTRAALKAEYVSDWPDGFAAEIS